MTPTVEESGSDLNPGGGLSVSREALVPLGLSHTRTEDKGRVLGGYGIR